MSLSTLIISTSENREIIYFHLRLTYFLSCLQGWNSEKSFEKYFVVRSIFLAEEVLLYGQKKYNCAVNHIRDRKNIQFLFFKEIWLNKFYEISTGFYWW